MDNQPIPTSNAPQQPVSQPPTPPPNARPIPPTPTAGPIPPTSSIPTTPVASVPPAALVSPVQPIASTTAAPQVDSPKKKSKGLIIGIICAVVLLIGGGVAAFIVLKTQPSNIIASSINNLLNAKHISVEGNINMATKGAYGNNSVNVNLTMLGSESNYSTTAHAEISLPMLGLYEPITLELNEVYISDGKVYAKIKGIKDVLSRNNIVTIGGSYVNDYAINIIENIGQTLEDRWIMISLEEILNNPMYPVDEQTKQKVLFTYDCTRNVTNNISNYSGEFSDLYKKHSFIIMQQQPDSFYSISFNPEQLADFGNSIPRTKLFQDLASCTGEDVEVVDSTDFTPESAKIFIERIPNISAKFDGFMDYHLSELKATDDSGYYSISTDLKFNYGDVPSISAPTDYTSITDIINEIVALMSQPSTAPVESNV